MREIKMILSYILLAIIGLGIILFGVAVASHSEILFFISFVIGISICVFAFFAARKLID